MAGSSQFYNLTIIKGFTVSKFAMAFALTAIGVGVFMAWCSADVHYAIKISACVIGAIASYKIVSPYAVDGNSGNHGDADNRETVTAKNGGMPLKIRTIVIVPILAVLGVVAVSVSFIAIKHRIYHGAWNFLSDKSGHTHVNGCCNSNDSGVIYDTISSVPSFDGGIDFGEVR